MLGRRAVVNVKQQYGGYLLLKPTTDSAPLMLSFTQLWA